MGAADIEGLPKPDYGRRLLVNVVDETAVADPTRTFLFAPRTNKPEDGWAPITYEQVARAVNHVAHIIAEKVKLPAVASDEGKEEFPTVAYVGPNDIRYAIILLASIKAGCKALFVSPWNSLEGQLSLFEKTNCGHIWYAQSSEAIVQPWIEKRPMQTNIVAAAEEWLSTTSEPYPYTRTFEQARFEPLAVLHTSGSTGIPKPIVVRQGSVAIADGFRNLPDYQGTQFMWKAWSSRAKRMFAPMPLFHAAGLLGCLSNLCMSYGVPIVLGIPDQPMSADLVMRCLAHSDVDSAFLPPSIVEEFSQTTESLDALKKLNFVIFSGGNLSTAAGDKLVKHGVFPSNIISSTEITPYATFFQPNPALWQYFIFNTEVMGAVWRCRDEKEGIYEHFIRRKDPNDPVDQPLFYTFPELTEWSTGDLYKKHPTLPDHWIYHGRADNIIVFSSGEKFNPVTVEDAIMGDSAIKGALVVGQDRFQPALILEPFNQPKNEEEARALIDQVWPVIEVANKTAVAHGQIVRQLVSLSDPNIPFRRASKGTIQRGLTVKNYESQIDEMYTRAEDVDQQDIVPLDFGTQELLTQSLIRLLEDKIGLKNVGPESDFFTLGTDSLRVIRMLSIIKGSCKAVGALDGTTMSPRLIYLHPTPSQLASALFSMSGDEKSIKEDDEREMQALESLVEKYTENLPAPAAKAKPLKDTRVARLLGRSGFLRAHLLERVYRSRRVNEIVSRLTKSSIGSGSEQPQALSDNQVVLLTGSTGSLGAYLLDELCKSTRVKKVIALNRGEDGGKSRQAAISEARGLNTDFTKVEFLGVDLSLPELGLDAAKYHDLLSTADRIVHNAWPVNFNIGVSSFEPHIRGVRHLVDFCSKSTKRVPLIFLSTISSVSAWESPNPVPEQRLEDASLAHMGYGRAKLASSLILDAAASQSGIPTATVRVGQIAGPRGQKGMWNKQEFMPTLIASSLYLGMLPDNLGPVEEVDWMPIEDVARLILDVSGVSIHAATAASASEPKGYYHCVNPTKTTWGKLVPTLQEYYGDRIRLVGFAEWVAALEKSVASTEDPSLNPGVKLLDTYKSMLRASQAGKGHVNLAMTRTMERSPTVAKLGPVTPELMRTWCSQWNF